MNQKKKPMGGLHLPPNDRLTGRTGVGRILQCDRRTVRRLERKGDLVPTLVDSDGVHWFDIEMVKRLATTFRRGWQIVRRKRSGSPPAKPKAPSDYRPELRSRRLAPDAPTTPPTARAPRSGDHPGVGPRTQIRPEWWDGDLSPDEAAEPEEPANADPKTAQWKPPGDPSSRK